MTIFHRHADDESAKRPVSRRRMLLFAAVMVLGVFGFLEGAAWIVYRLSFPAERRHALEASLDREASESLSGPRFLPHPYFNYICNPDFSFPDGVKPHNSRGFRKPEWPAFKAPGSLRIVAVGGSTTYGMHYETSEETWPFMVQELLKKRLDRAVEVVNLGVPNYTPHEAVALTAMLVPVLEPDVVLFHLGANNAFTVGYPDEGGPDNTTFRFSYTYRTLPPLVRVLMSHLNLARVIGAGVMLRQGHLHGEMGSTMQYPVPADAEVNANARRATGRYFRQVMRALIALTRDLGAIPVLITQPLDPHWEKPRPGFYGEVAKAHKRNNQITRELGGELGVPVVDLYPVMRDPELFNDAVHASPLGMKTKAELVARSIEIVLRRATEAGIVDRAR